MALLHRVGWDAAFLRRSPWFWPLTAAAARFASRTDWPLRADFDALYAEHATARGAEPLRFVENVKKTDKHDGDKLVLARLYDGRIALGSEVPTRERDWHDFFNALCFATYPRAKRALHRRQFAILQRRIEPGATRLPPARIPEQDSLTLFDEGGAVVATEARSAQQLMAAPEADRAELLRELSDSKCARIIPFGHALFEHLVEGLRCPGGSTRIVELPTLNLPDAALLTQVDQSLAAQLEDPTIFLTPKESSHLRLPALGLGEAGAGVVD